MKGRDPMKGRHAVGVQRVSTGKQRSGQSEPASNKGGGITGVARSSPSRSQQPKPPVLSDAAHPSADAQKLIRRPPQPFENPNSTVNNRPAPSPAGAKPGLEPRIKAGLSGATVTARALPQTNAVGYRGTTPTNGNNQVVSGRTGSQQLARKRGDNAFQSVKRNASFYGE